MVERSPHVNLHSGWASRGSVRSRFRYAAPGWLTIGLVALSVLLGACSNAEGGVQTEEDRRFVNDPTRPSQPTKVVVPTVTAPAASPAANLPPADALFKARGAPATVYAIITGEILVLRPAVPRAEPLRIAPPPGQAFARLTSSPTGDRVAAMVVPVDGVARSGARGTLVVYDAAGTTVRTWNDVVSLGPSGATPVSTEERLPGQSPIQMEWASQGDQILITSGFDELVSVPLEGTPVRIDVPPGIRVIEEAHWSPRGNQIAILASGGDGPPGVQLFTPNVEPSDLRQVAPSNEGTIAFPTIEQFAWLPDGSGIAYILADERTGSPVDGQLFVHDLARGDHRLIATPGQGGPSASIANFVLSPDGKAVIYQIQTSDTAQWTFHSLWVRSLTDTRAVRLPVDDVIEVNALWWTAQGVVWGQALETEGAGATETFVLQAPGSAPVELISIEVVPAQVASPVASPAATPLG